MIGSVPWEVLVRDFTFTPLLMMHFYVLGSWRVSKHLIRIIFTISSAAMLAIEILVSLHFSSEWYEITRSFLQAVIFFSSIVLMKERGVRVLIPIITSVSVVTVLSMFYLMVRGFIPNIIVNLVISFVLQCLGLLITFKVLRKPLRDMMKSLERGWWMIAFCIGCPVLIFTAISVLPTEGYPPGYLAALYGTAAVTVVNHAVVFTIYRIIRQQYKAQEESRIMAIQLATTKAQVETMGTLEKEVRILSHDLRHVASTVSVALRAEDYETAGETMDALIRQIDSTEKHRPAHYCELPIVNAAVSFYANDAAAHHIETDIRIRIDKKLPCEELELAVVLSNCMENAVHAMTDLPDEKRKLSVLVRFANSQLFIQVENYFAGELLLDEDTGLPAARQDGHGIGMTSIMSFAKKYDAMLSCTQADGRFSVRIIL